MPQITKNAQKPEKKKVVNRLVKCLSDMIRASKESPAEQTEGLLDHLQLSSEAGKSRKSRDSDGRLVKPRIQAQFSITLVVF
jgi:hypothetical protein